MVKKQKQNKRISVSNRNPLLGMVKFVFKFVFFWNPNEISVFIFTYLLLR